VLAPLEEEDPARGPVVDDDGGDQQCHGHVLSVGVPTLHDPAQDTYVAVAEADGVIAGYVAWRAGPASAPPGASTPSPTCADAYRRL
jgi:hypothetical protein